MNKKQKIKVEGIEIITFSKNNSDYVYLTQLLNWSNLTSLKMRLE